MKNSLYERLGAAEGIKILANDIAENHLANPLIKSRFEIIEDLDAVKKVKYFYNSTAFTRAIPLIPKI